jgi:hypothetical protein
MKREQGAAMGKVMFDISMSLDGFMTAAGITSAEPMEQGGQRLHQWAMESSDRGDQAPTRRQRDRRDDDGTLARASMVHGEHVIPARRGRRAGRAAG